MVAYDAGLRYPTALSTPYEHGFLIMAFAGGALMSELSPAVIHSLRA